MPLQTRGEILINRHTDRPTDPTTVTLNCICTPRVNNLHFGSVCLTLINDYVPTYIIMCMLMEYSIMTVHMFSVWVVSCNPRVSTITRRLSVSGGIYIQHAQLLTG